MGNENSFDFKSFVLANNGQLVTGFDYLHTIYKTHGLSSDFIVFFAKLFWPDFKVIDGVVFISELFDSEYYQSFLKDGRNINEAQFWMNLLEITGLFDGLSIDEAVQVSEIVVKSWNFKLGIECGNVSVLARFIRDDETGEVFVTIGKPD